MRHRALPGRRPVRRRLRAGKRLPPVTRSSSGGMMAGMRPEQARQFYEEDEDPKKVIGLFDAARDEGRLSQTRPPKPRPEPMPLADLLTEPARELRPELPELRIPDRLARQLQRAADALRSNSRVH